MIDFPIGEHLDDRIGLLWIECRLHAEGFPCPRCGGTERRLCRELGHFLADRGRICEGYYSRLMGTVCEKMRQRPATRVLWLREIAKGEPMIRLARDLGLSRQQFHTPRQRLQANRNATAPTGVMTGTALEADELYQNAGENTHATS
jgi:hypothetical protein